MHNQNIDFAAQKRLKIKNHAIKWGSKTTPERSEWCTNHARTAPLRVEWNGL